MAADGAWPHGSGSEPLESGDERTRRAVDQLRAVLDALEVRFAQPGLEPMAPQAMAALVQALNALARRMARLEEDAADRAADLRAALATLAERLEGQAAAQDRADARHAASLGDVLAELAQVRAEQATPARADPGPIRAVLMLAGAAAALSVMGAGTYALQQAGALPRTGTAPLAALADLPLRRSLGVPPRPAAVATAQPILPAISAAPRTVATGDSYDAVDQALERGEPTALPRLTGLAHAGDVRAQVHLASLYETGAASVTRDMAAARFWIQRAAEGGDRAAMHNLALYLAGGEGGARDVPQAIGWFRRAADLGVVDSQYNLGLLYEAGRGVGQNLNEAYRWFAIAANAGDLAAREKVVELEARLKPAERSGLDRDVSSFQPGAARLPDLALVIPPAATLAETQALLARQGYYVGPIDGVASPALRIAASVYLRDHPGAAAAAPASP